MSAIERARELFSGAGLAFPSIPDELADRLVEKGEWLFSTREIELGLPDFLHPYFLRKYVEESASGNVEDYAVLAHGGHGVNSYAIQYYLVFGRLRLFLHLGWGGVYMDAQAAREQIRVCFAQADKIFQVVPRASLTDLETLTIVGSDFYGSYWQINGQPVPDEDHSHERPYDVFDEALRWVMPKDG
ncbi:MAG: hypothetical protein ABI559_05930 [Chloroflexota bacterium]